MMKYRFSLASLVTFLALLLQYHMQRLPLCVYNITLFLLVISLVINVSAGLLATSPIPCRVDVGKPCQTDGLVGSKVIYEDSGVRVWNFTLASGEMTSMHRHDFDYHFIAVKPTQLEVWSESGERLFDFRAEGVLGFKVVGDFLEPQNKKLPWPVPRIHAAKNIGPEDYFEILVEHKVPQPVSSYDSHREQDL